MCNHSDSEDIDWIATRTFLVETKNALRLKFARAAAKEGLYIPLAEGVLLEEMQLQMDMLASKLKAAYEACMVTLDEKCNEQL